MIDIKKIFIFIIILVIIVIFYFILRPTQSTLVNKEDKCKHCGDLDCDKLTGKCIEPVKKCGSDKPTDTKCNYICIQDKWMCDGATGCETSYLPNSIGSCSLNDIKCKDGYFYCPADTTSCNEGDLYFRKDGNTCSNCPLKTYGDKCEKECKNGSVTTGNCVCTDNTYYGDNCGEKCGKNKIYVDGKCVCGPFYDVDGDNCKEKVCPNGKINNGNCICNDGYTGANCDTSICNKNQTYKDGKCTCLTNTDGFQYYGPNCDVYKCRLASEFVVDSKGVPSCNCSSDNSCGLMCQHTSENKCNKNGTPNCNGTGDFVDCKCNVGYTGTNCQCKISDKPNTDDPCKGDTSYCSSTGWVQNTYSSNDDFLKKNEFTGQDDWYTKCFSKNCPGLLSGTMSLNSNLNNSPRYTCTGCPKLNNVQCSNGQIALCDDSTVNNWKCVDRKENTTCPPATKDINNMYCMNNGQQEPPTCFHCDDKTSEWICTNSGGNPSYKCLQKAVGIELETGVIGTIQPIYYNTSSLVFKPTTDAEACDSYLDSYFNGRQQNDVNSNPFTSGYNFKTLLNNPEGTFDHNTKLFTAIGNNRYFNAKVGDFNDKCIYTDEMIKKYITKSSKDEKLCNGKNFIQDKDNGNFLPSGKCDCGDFKGSNCQYSDKETCSGNGTVDDNGTCKCNTGYLGTNCKYTCKVDDKNSGEIIDGKCDYTKLCSYKYPRCKSCTNTDNYDNMTCSETIDNNIFSSKCTPRDKVENGIFGCPIIKDSTFWSKYTGLSCHHNTVDYNNCNKQNGAVISQYDVGQKYDFCQINDFTTIPEFKSINTEGLNAKVSSFFLANQENNVIGYQFPKDDMPVHQSNDMLSYNLTDICKTNPQGSSIRVSDRDCPLNFGEQGSRTNWM
jgi:hypothetical protein